MYCRIALGAFVAVGALSFPAGALASPLPDQSTRTSSSDCAIQPALHQLQQAYRLGAIQEKHSIHNDMVLLIDVGRSAL
jgi:hypothetical protein